MAPPEWRANGGPILSNNGGSILSNNGGSILANNGSGIVAQGGGLISPGTGIPTGGKWLRPGEVGADLVAHGSGSLISPGTGIPTGGKWLRPEEPLEGARIRAFSATGAIAKDAQGQALEARSNAEGRFAFAQAPVGPGPFLLQAETVEGRVVVAAFVNVPSQESVMLDVGTTLAVNYLAGIAMLSGLDGVSGVHSGVLLDAAEGVSQGLSLHKDKFPDFPGPAMVNQVLNDIFEAFPESASAVEKLGDEVTVKAQANFNRFELPTWLALDEDKNLVVLDRGNGGVLKRWSQLEDSKVVLGPHPAIYGAKQFVNMGQNNWAVMGLETPSGVGIFVNGVYKDAAFEGVVHVPSWTSMAYSPKFGLILCDGTSSIYRLIDTDKIVEWSRGWPKPKVLASNSDGNFWIATAVKNQACVYLFDGESRSGLGEMTSNYWGEFENEDELPIRFIAQRPIEDGSLILGFNDRASRLKRPKSWFGQTSFPWAFILGVSSPLLNGPRLGGTLTNAISGVWSKGGGLYVLSEGRLDLIQNGISDAPTLNIPGADNVSQEDGTPVQLR